jgi:RNA polymerase sigma factor (TIGR02999 family)
MPRQRFPGASDHPSYAASSAQVQALIPDEEQRTLVDNLFSATYEELRRLASYVNRGQGRSSLSPTTLVNEAWLKLSGSHSHQFQSVLHFKATAARAMRQILVEAARRQGSQKRGGGEVVFVDFDDLAAPIQCDRQLLALHESLDELARVNPRQALLVESRYFGGMEVSETAELLKVSEATVLRDWRVAKAFLGVQIRSRC